VLEAARSESDVVFSWALSLARPSSFYTVYVDDLARTFPQGTNHSLYADDLATWSSSHDPFKAAHTVQKAIDHLKE